MTLFWILLALLIPVVVLAALALRRTARLGTKVHEGIIEFREAEPYEPNERAPGSAARITKVDFTRRTPMHRPVRRYDVDEDAADPFR